MANRHRGEIDAVLDGRQWKLCLTLGALAELECAFGAQDLVSLTQRFSTGALTSDDMLKIIGAGLRGAGHLLDDDAVREMQADGAAVGFAKIVSDLLSVTFGNAS